MRAEVRVGALRRPKTDVAAGLSDIKTYGMSECAEHLDFDIRDQTVRPALIKLALRGPTDALALNRLRA